MHLSITTPRGSLVDAEVDELSAPGALGEFGVLPGHIPFLSGLKPGVLVFRQKSEQHVLAVGEGVLQVARTEGGEKVRVLVQEAAAAGEIDPAAAAKEVAAADQEIAHWTGELDGNYKALLVRRAWAAARVDAAGRRVAH